MLSNLIKSNQTFIRHSLFSYFVLAFNILSSIYAVRENISILQKDLYGVWILVFSISGIMGVLHFGFNTISIFKFNDYKKFGRLQVYFANNLIAILLQVILTIIVFVIVYTLSDLIVNNKEYVEIFKQMFLLALPGIILTSISSYFEAVLFYNFKLIYFRNVLELLRLGILNVIFVILIGLTGNILYLPIAFSVTSLIAFAYSFYRFNKLEKITINMHLVERNYFVRNSHDGFSFWVLGISNYVIAQMDVFFIAMIKGDFGLVTMYSQSFRLQEISLRFIKKITESKAPKILSLYNSGNHKAVTDIYKKLLLINLVLSTVVFVLIAFLGKYILEIWLDKAIIFDQTLIVVLSLICITGSLHWVLWNFCNLTGQQNKVKNIVIIEILSNLIFSCILLKNFGLVGLGIASIISNSITIVYIYSLFAKYTRNHLEESNNMIEN